MRTAALSACAVLAAAPAHAANLKVGQPAPNFEVTTFDGKKVSLADLKGQVVVVNIWATWCGPCKVELPLINAYYRIQQPHGLAVLAVTTEDSVPQSFLRPLAKLLDIPLAHNLRGGGYGVVEAVPTNYVIDRNGILRYAKPGSFTLDALNEILVPLLREPAPSEPAISAASTPVG
jgi:peroxiredoxin